VELSSGRPVGVEASVRWQHPRDGLIGPEDFMPVAEDTGLIIDIGRFVLREACRQAREWIDAGMGLEVVTVRVSATQIRRSDLVATAEDVLGETGLPPRRLELDVAETVIAALGESGIDTLSALGRLGIRFAIEDFGRGHTSLAVLGRLPVQRLKIACCLVGEMPGDATAAAVARAVAAVADSLGLEVLAEGVETPAQAALLEQDGCRYAQGALFGLPVAAAELRRCWDRATFLSSRAGAASGRA
jgi:EAL domain-containing protein (putative c-di-GMP-specific phosphodiesterase class I)